MRHFTDLKVELLGRPFPQIRGLSEETILSEDKLITMIGREEASQAWAPCVLAIVPEAGEDTLEPGRDF